MQTMRRSLICLFTIVAAASCGKSAPEASLSSFDKAMASHQIVVVLGGFSSCATPLHSPYQGSLYEPSVALVRRLQSSAGVQSVDYLLSCFGQSNESLRYVTELEDGKSESGSIDDLHRLISSRINMYGPNHDLHIIGHSYGGALAKEILLRLPSSTRVRTAATLDPISRKNCTAGDFIRAYTRSVINIKPHPGCTEPPRDLAPAFASINQKTARWVNVYQVQYAYLHSGFIGEADENLQREYDVNPLLAHEAHSLVNSDEGVWQRIFASSVPQR